MVQVAHCSQHSVGGTALVAWYSQPGGQGGRENGRVAPAMRSCLQSKRNQTARWLFPLVQTIVWPRDLLSILPCLVGSRITREVSEDLPVSQQHVSSRGASEPREEARSHSPRGNCWRGEGAHRPRQGWVTPTFSHVVGRTYPGTCRLEPVKGLITSRLPWHLPPLSSSLPLGSTRHLSF